MNIVYIAYSCFWGRGSEETIGWRIPLECAKENNVFVITKIEYKKCFEEYLKEHPEINIKFYYADIPKFFKRIFKGPFYSGRINLWMHSVNNIVKDILRDNKIDVIHQITPVEFRSVAGIKKIGGCKLVLGPIGGGEYIPKALYGYADNKMEIVRRITNRIIEMRLRINRALDKYDCIMFSNMETKDYLSKCFKSKVTKVYSEIGIDNIDNCDRKKEKEDDRLNILFAGRLVYRKGVSFLLDALKKLPEDATYNCRIVGMGQDRIMLEEKCNALGLKNVEFAGSVPFEKMRDEYNRADIFVMPSLRETTGSVILEAMSHGLPVVAMNKFGAAEILSDDTAFLYDGDTQEEMINALAYVLSECIDNIPLVKSKGIKALEKACEYTWNKKYRIFMDIYKK